MFRLRWTVLLSWAVLAVLYPVPGQSQNTSCTPQDTQLCLQGGRFLVEVAWQIPGGGSGHGHAVPLTSDTGLFWFFDNSNVELVIKVLDGRPVNGRFWVYYGGLSDVAYTIAVTDLETQMRKVYSNPPGQLASRSDTSAFPAPLGFPVINTSSLSASPLLRQGPEFQANATTPGDQRSPSVAITSDGGYMVAWTGQTSRISDVDAMARFYDRTGQPLTGEVRLHADAAGNQLAARAAGSLGGYMAVWLDEDRVFGRVFDKRGVPLGDEFRIGTRGRPQGAPSITWALGSSYLVAWAEPGDDSGTLPSIRWQRYNSQGQREGVEIAIERPGGEPRVAVSPLGGFVVTWIEAAGLFETDILALLLDYQGAPVDNQALRVNTDSRRWPGYHGDLSPVCHPDGGFSIVWSTYAFLNRPGSLGVYARRYDAQGQATTRVVSLRAGSTVLATDVAAAALPSGDTLVVWFEEGHVPAPDGGLYGQIYDSSWSEVGGRTRINTYTTDLQTEPALAADWLGNIVAAWGSGIDDPGILLPPGFGLGTQDGDFYGVFGQRFTLASCALDDITQLCLGGRFRVEVRFTDPRNGQQGTAHAIPLTSDTGTFWFFGDTNAELVLKVLDGRLVNGRFWVYYGALTDVAYTITVTDTLTNQTKTYSSPQGRLGSRADTEAF